MQFEDSFQILDTFRRLPQVRKFIIALSGGVDSVALIHNLSRLQAQLPQSLLAVHIHHGLMADADLWTAQCESLCKQLKLPLEVVRVKVDTRKKSLEAAAREARYAALQEYIRADTALLTAHHQDDQAETILLHLTKGAGSAGLAGMPISKRFGRGWHFRPLLPVTRAALQKYVLLHKLPVIEDPSNFDTQHERNYLRHQIIPEFTERWPSATRGMARSARHQSENIRLQNDLAEIDIRQVVKPDGALTIPRLKQLKKHRQRNCLRYWLRNMGGEDVNPSTDQLASLMKELMNSAWDSEPELQLGSKTIHRYRDRLYQLPKQKNPEINKEYVWELDKTLKIPSLGIVLEPWGVLAAYQSLNKEDKLVVRFRQGGEKIRIYGHRNHRPLKKLFQEWGVPPWRRNYLPLIYQDGELLMVWGYASAR